MSSKRPTLYLESDTGARYAFLPEEAASQCSLIRHMVEDGFAINDIEHPLVVRVADTPNEVLDAFGKAFSGAPCSAFPWEMRLQVMHVCNYLGAEPLLARFFAHTAQLLIDHQDEEGYPNKAFGYANDLSLTHLEVLKLFRESSVFGCRARVSGARLF